MGWVIGTRSDKNDAGFTEVGYARSPDQALRRNCTKRMPTLVLSRRHRTRLMALDVHYRKQALQRL